MTAPGRSSGTGLRPLLLVCALGIERLALRGGPGAPGVVGPHGPHGPHGREDTGGVRDREGAERRRGPVSWPGGSVTVLRTGMGPRAAARATARALAGEPVPGVTAVAVTGFCAGLQPGMRPGDVVVADETRPQAGGRTPCTGHRALADTLARRPPESVGRLRTVHTGPLAGTDHLVRGRERSVLGAGGAIAADMESAAVLSAALGTGRRPVAAVRVVVDAPGWELIRFGTLRGGISAFRVLRTVTPALYEWHRSQLLPRR